MDFFSKNFSIHDKFQLETIFNYSLENTGEKNAYQVDTYFFLPDSLGINPETYSREDFFADMQRYIRLKTPVLYFDQIFEGENSPLQKLERSVQRLAADQSQVNRKFYVDRMKMLCSILKSALRDETQVLSQAVHQENFPALTDEMIRKVSLIVEQFRGLKEQLQKSGIPEEDRIFFQHADEFISLILEKYTGRLWTLLDTRKLHPETAKKLCRFDIRELQYRKSCGYPSVPSANSDNNELLYRKSTLKKVMASVLFLRSSRRKDGVFLENLLLCAAAGIAMIFATGISFAWKGLFLEEFSMAFFIIWVVAYMGKDRIKELLRIYFQKELRHIIFDYKTLIWTALGHRIGFCKESMVYPNEDKIDPEVLKIRGRSYLSGLENEGYREQIIQYRKLVELHPKLSEKLFQDFHVTGLVDIMRINVSSFLRKMDNPGQEVLIPDPEAETMVKIKGKRCYHINIVVRYGTRSLPPQYRHFRVILTRAGIQKVETVQTANTSVEV